MEMEEDMTTRLQGIVNDAKLSKDEKVKALQGLYSHATAEQPGAEESVMIDEDALAQSVQHIKKALQDLGAPLGDGQNPAKSV